VTPSIKPLYTNINDISCENFRVCVTCMMSKPIDDFERYKGNNRRKSCKPCHRQETKDRVKAMQEENPLSSKICGKCGVEKVLADFPVSPTHKGGRHTYCRECNTKYAHDKQDRKMAEERESLAILYASMDPSARPLPKSCGNPQCCFGTGEQPPENFKISKIHKSGLRIYCRICQTQRKREFEAINRSEDKTAKDEWLKEYHRQWHQEHKDELYKQVKEWRDANPEECRRLHIERRFRNYGVTQEWYDKTLAAQGGGCAICGSTDPKNPCNTFAIDHDHSCCPQGYSCGKCIRGLLCFPCNSRLAHLENVAWKRKAISYLNKHRRDNSNYDEVQSSLFDL